jgi:hypothetical protein
MRTEIYSTEARRRHKDRPTAIKSCAADNSLLHLQQICSKSSPNGCTARPDIQPAAEPPAPDRSEVCNTKEAISRSLRQNVNGSLSVEPTPNAWSHESGAFALEIG